MDEEKQIKLVKKLIQLIWKIISYKLIKKGKYYNYYFKLWMKTKRYRIIHPVWFIFFIILFITITFTDWILEFIRVVKKDFCII